MNEENIHQRTFEVRLEFTDEERDQFFERLGLSLDDERSITRAIQDEIASNLEEVGLRPTITMLAHGEDNTAYLRLLSGCEGETEATADCGCKLTQEEDGDVALRLCPMHEDAKRLERS